MVTTAILDSRVSGINEALARKGAGFAVHATANFKNNGVKRAGYMLDSGRAISPVMYPTEELLASSDDELADRIIALDADADEDTKDINIPDMLSADFILANVRPRLYGAGNRKDMDEIGRVYTDFLDMLIGYYVVIPAMSGEDGISSIAVTRDLLSSADLTVDDIRDRAVENLTGETQVRAISEVLSEFMGVDLLGEELAMPELMLVSNLTSVYGASAILSEEVQERLCEVLGDSWIILPSSIHECIAVPSGMMDDVKEMAEMVRSINCEHVKDEEVLTDSVYLYSDGDIRKVA